MNELNRTTRHWYTRKAANRSGLALRAPQCANLLWTDLGRMFLAFIGIGIISMTLVSCAIGPTALEADYGMSVSLATSGQLLDPAAQQNLAPVYGFDAKAAAATIERYQTSFEKPAPPPSFVISVGQGR